MNVSAVVKRSFFVGGLASCVLPVTLSRSVFAESYRPDSRIRALWLARPGSGEEIRVPFTRDGRTIYRPGYYAISWILRDHQVDPQIGYVAISINLIEALWEMQSVLRRQGIDSPLNITSGYRTPETNARTEGAVKNSQHIEGKAVDLYVDGVSNRELFDICWSREITGGDGLYDDHIHVDSGPRRFWSG